MLIRSKIFSAKKLRLVLPLILLDLGLALYLILNFPIQTTLSSSFQNLISSGAKQIGLILHRPSFKNVTTETSIDPRPAHGGVSWTDFDSDGLLDLLYPTPKGLSLYRGNGQSTFSDVTQKSGLGGIVGVYAGIFGDYDNNGCPDLYLSRNGFESKFPPLDSVGLTDLLFKNNCDGTFSDVSKESGIKDLYHGEGASWVDYNSDGLLDIYVVNIGRWKDENNWVLEPNLLYKNKGQGIFQEVSAQAGISGYAKCPTFDAGDSSGTRPNRGGWKISFQPIWFDYNNDGRPDLFIATDAGISPLYKNLRHGQFADATEEAGLCVEGSGMGVAAGDYDNNGHLDLYVTNNGRNYLWQNSGSGTFREVSREAGVDYQGTLGWGTSFLDYNNDTFLDLYAVSGALTQNDLSYRGEKLLDKLFKNLGGRFEDVSLIEGITGEHPKLSGAFGDFNNDGFTDMVVVSNSKNPAFLKQGSKIYQNKPNNHNWITVQLVGRSSNRDGIGARIILESSGVKQAREVIAGSSYLSQDSLWQTFGLGTSKVISQLTVIWPSGTKQILTGISPNKKIIIEEAASSAP